MYLLIKLVIVGLLTASSIVPTADTVTASASAPIQIASISGSAGSLSE